MLSAPQKQCSKILCSLPRSACGIVFVASTASKDNVSHTASSLCSCRISHFAWNLEFSLLFAQSHLVKSEQGRTRWSTAGVWCCSECSPGLRLCGTGGFSSQLCSMEISLGTEICLPAQPVLGALGPCSQPRAGSQGPCAETVAAATQTGLSKN